MERVRAGLWLVAAAPVAWVVLNAVRGRTDDLAPLLLMAAGLAVAAWAVPAERRWAGLAGLVVAALALGLFYGFDAYSGLPQRAGSIVALGLMIGVVALAVDAPRGLAAGLLVVASGGLLWVYVDWWEWHWEVGNLLLVGGAITASVAAWHAG